MKNAVPLEQSLYLLHPYNSCLVTSIGSDGKPNVMTVAWIVPISVNPPLLGMSILPKRHSHKLIMESGEFVINIPTFDNVQAVLTCGRMSGRDHDKFKEAKLAQARAKKLKSPIIDECIAHLECNVVKTIEIGDHTLIVGEIIAAYALNGFFDLVYSTKFWPCLHIGKDYFTTWKIMRKEPRLKNT
jgi:flavin reductase (DIM6/NTAB) family NADH-FMN oxidoreductase RutF